MPLPGRAKQKANDMSSKRFVYNKKQNNIEYHENRLLRLVSLSDNFVHRCFDNDLRFSIFSAKKEWSIKYREDTSDAMKFKDLDL